MLILLLASTSRLTNQLASLDPAKILKKHKKEKQDKYLDLCLACCCHFTPLVFLVDGMRDMEVQATSKHLVLHLSTKWKAIYSKACLALSVPASPSPWPIP